MKDHNIESVCNQKVEAIAKECYREPLIICGGAGQGKSNTLKLLAWKLMENPNTIVRCYDHSRAWRVSSPFKYFIELTEEQLQTHINIFVDTITLEQNIQLPLINESMLYYTGKVWGYGTDALVQEHIRLDWFSLETMLDENNDKITQHRFWIFEEAKNLVGSNALRRFENKGLSDAIAEGRNRGLGFLICGRRISEISTSVTEHCLQYLFFRTLGYNDHRRIRGLTNNEVSNQIKTLKVGQGIYWNGKDEPQLIKFPLFPPMKPQQLYPMKLTLRDQIRKGIAQLPKQLMAKALGW